MLDQTPTNIFIPSTRGRLDKLFGEALNYASRKELVLHRRDASTAETPPQR